MTHQIEAKIYQEVEITFTGTYVAAEPDRGPEYGASAGPGNGVEVDDVEATGLWADVLKRDRYGRVERDDRGRLQAERVNLLAGISEDARREVLIALTDAFLEDGVDALIEAEVG
jgi:hypothetical protein